VDPSGLEHDTKIVVTVVSIMICIIVSYDFAILLLPIDTYHDGILIWYSLRSKI
jgi:hypothetical protein